jgi:hypothetical protein
MFHSRFICVGTLICREPDKSGSEKGPVRITGGLLTSDPRRRYRLHQRNQNHQMPPSTNEVPAVCVLLSKSATWWQP